MKTYSIELDFNHDVTELELSELAADYYSKYEELEVQRDFIRGRFTSDKLSNIIRLINEYTTGDPCDNDFYIDQIMIVYKNSTLNLNLNLQ